MNRRECLGVAALCAVWFYVGAEIGANFVAWPASYDAVSSDPYHDVCIREGALDLPDTWAGAKGARLPPTCADEPMPLDREMFAKFHGYDEAMDLPQDTWATIFYRWHRVHEPGTELIRRPPDPVTAPVPLPGGLWLMCATLTALWITWRMR